MEFEYDPAAKSAANKDKHGIDFEEAKALWEDDGLVGVGAEFEGEERYLVIGQIAGKHWAAFWTPRRGNIRLISVRRARKKEIDYYEGN